MALATGQRALMVARMGIAKLGATRLGYLKPKTFVYINGVDVTAYVRLDNGSIEQSAGGSTPWIADFRIAGIVPVEGQDVKLYLGDGNPSRLEFAGNINIVS